MAQSYKLVLDSFLGGLAQSDRIGVAGSYYVGSSINPIFPISKGYLNPGGTPVSLHNTATGRMSSLAIDNLNNQAYLTEVGLVGSKIQQYQIIQNRLTRGTVFPHTISKTTSSPSAEDIKIYSVGASKYVFYSWNDYPYAGSDYGAVGRYDISGATFDDDWLESIPAGASDTAIQTSYPHPMLEWGTSGFLYIADGRYLHQFDGQNGANGTFTAQRFALPYGWVITSLFDAGELIGITAVYYTGTTWAIPSYGSKSAVFFWDGTSNSYNKRCPIDDPMIRASKTINGDYYIFCDNNEGEGVIRKYINDNFPVVQSIRSNVAAGSGLTRFGRTINHYGSIGVLFDGLLFGGNRSSIGTGEIFCYSKPDEGLSERLFNITNTTGTAEMVIYLTETIGDNIIVSSYSALTMAYYIEAIPIAGYNNPNYLFKSLYYEFPKKVRLNYINLYFMKLESGQGIDVLLEKDYEDTNNQIHVGDISYSGDGAITKKKISCKNTLCNNFRVVLDKDEGAGVRVGKIIVGYTYLDEEIE